jgi:hypothetical protein
MSNNPIEGQSTTVLETTPGSILGAAENCLIMIWRGVATETMYLRIGEELVTLTQRFPHNCAYLDIVESKATPPSAALRKIAMQNVRRVEDKLGCAVVVIEGSELRSTLVRAVLTGMSLLLPRMRNTKIVRNVDDATAWIKKTLSLQDAEFERRMSGHVEEIRRQIPTSSDR